MGVTLDTFHFDEPVKAEDLNRFAQSCAEAFSKTYMGGTGIVTSVFKNVEFTNQSVIVVTKQATSSVVVTVPVAAKQAQFVILNKSDKPVKIQTPKDQIGEVTEEIGIVVCDGSAWTVANGA
jgi:hypothetical protein